MKNKVLKLLLLLLVALLALSAGLVSCTPPEEPDDEPIEPSDPTYPEDDLPLDGLVLIRKNVAQFKVVIASGAGSEGRRAARDLVDRLRELGVEISDPIEDKDAAAVTDCEIIVGAGVKNRPDECVISVADLGPQGQTVRVVGNRVVCVGGTINYTRKAVEKLVKEYMGIDANTETKRNVAIALDLNDTALTDYQVDKITIAGNDLAQYKIVCDENDLGAFPYVTDGIKKAVYNCAGYNLSVVKFADATDADKKIIVRTVADAGNDGFRVYVDDSANLIVECSIVKLFADTATEFINNEISVKVGEVAFNADYEYSKHIRTITYAQFGVKGDGKDGDFEAIVACHKRANETGQTVVAKGTVGNKFYIGKTWPDDPAGPAPKDEERTMGVQIPVKSNCDFTGAEFIIDDTVSGIHYATRRSRAIFGVSSDKRSITFTSDPEASNKISLLGEGISLKAGATSIPFITQYLSGGDCFVHLVNEKKLDYVRYGKNADDGGKSRQEVLIVHGDGTISKDTPLTVDFSKITQISIRSIDDTPITIKGGKFTTKNNKGAAQSKMEYDTYNRGIRVGRANVTIQNIEHVIQGEPTSSSTSSYPYYGFVSFYYAVNSTLKDSKLSGHKCYMDNKDRTMGTYDLVMEHSIGINIVGLEQYRNIRDTNYWGIHASNGSRNMKFKDVNISRVDAHRGLYNLDIIDSTIGSYINIIGGGTLNITNTTKLRGDAFIDLRSDYGSTFSGTVNLKNCKLEAYKSSSGTSREGTAYIIKSGFPLNNHNFGYTCYMPQYVNIENFKSGVSSTYVFNNVNDSAFNSYGYKICKKITFKGSGTKWATCPTTGTKLGKVTREYK